MGQKGSKTDQLNKLLTKQIENLKNIRNTINEFNQKDRDVAIHEHLIYEAFRHKSKDLLQICNQITEPGEIHTPSGYLAYSKEWPEGWRFLTSLILQNCCQKCGLLKS
jgi:hypothetical protein